MQTRTEAVQAAMDDIQTIETDLGVTREGVVAIRDRLVELTSQRELFPLEDFPPPGDEHDGNSYMYRLAQDGDDRFALYAQSTRGHVETPPHNHTTWAVVVGFEGQELNHFYVRSEDGGVDETHEETVQAGRGVAMLPDDLHSIRIDGTALNFHCYGLALERLDQREYYDREAGEWKIFSNVAGIREARAGLQSC
jgi:predicted metal-dependent enzyme (double-stranded beta helix superfamily)